MRDVHMCINYTKYNHSTYTYLLLKEMSPKDTSALQHAKAASSGTLKI